MAVIVAALAIAGCDRQNPATSQGSAASAGSGNRASAAGAATRFRIDRANAGTAIPATVVIAPDGTRRPLSSVAGKPTLLNLWATWCAPCVEELPTLNTVAQRAGDRAQVVLLSQDIGDDAAVPRRFLTERNLANLATWHDPENAVGLMMGQSLPTTILFAADGKEVARVIGPLDWTGAQARALLREAGFPG